jgi:glycerol-3-phosphate dehydrogenase subunit C
MMNGPASSDGIPEKTMRGVVDACTDCDVCRFLMDESCLLFPELYHLYDKEKAQGRPAGGRELMRLSELCTLCGLCPCPNIRADVIRAKIERVGREGLPLHLRLLADVQRLGRWGSIMPGIFNSALSFTPLSRLAKKIARVHPPRRLPRIAAESFFAWAHAQGLDREPNRLPKAAYFAGCTAGYIFPEVARAAVAVMEANGISVYVPPQQCCGMPTLLEGDLQTTRERVRSNLETLLKVARNGYDLVCSCPTCGYFMKILLKENACYSQAYQRSVNAGKDEIIVPDAKAGKDGYVRLKKSMYAEILRDDGCFSDFDPLDRIALSENIMDMGEYLSDRLRKKTLKLRFGKLDGRMAYYAPCHQREQGIGSPYEELLCLIPGLSVERVGGAMDCCGMGGSLGFKASFSDRSIELGRPLMRKIKAAAPDAIVTDCLSCRLQFTHTLPFPVYHPLEVLQRAYALYGDAGIEAG